MRLNSWVMSASSVKWVRLGECIELCSERNTQAKYSLDDAMGMTITKEIIPTKANLQDNDLSKFWIVNPKEFVYNPRTHGKKIGLGFNNTDKPFIISWNNIAFRVKDQTLLLPDYLYVIICREEWDRNACFRSWGSSTEVFSWSEFTLMEIPLPTIEVQQELVDTYNGLKALAEQNEALIEPLSKACEAFIVDCKNKYPEVELGEYIEEGIEKNRDYQYDADNARGVYCDGTFGDTKANLVGSDLAGYKIVHTGDFAYSNRINIGSIALNFGESLIVSPSYTVFRLRSNQIIPKFLFILFRRNEFLRSTLFYAIGTIKDDFSYERMGEVKIPLPPIETQQSIVNLYNCLEEAKKIASEAREKLKTLCPALVQRAANS